MSKSSLTVQFRYEVPPYTSHLLYTKRATGPQTQLTVMVLVGLKIVSQLKIIESFGLKPASHFTVKLYLLANQDLCIA